jgi:hypothetical protein
VGDLVSIGTELGAAFDHPTPDAGGGCDSGLVCLSNLCVNPGASTGSPTSTATSVGTDSGAGTATTVALGTNNPAQGDCATNTSEAATSVGSVALSFTSSSFWAEIQLQSGYPNMSYGVFMQQVPGSCPQPSVNAGTLATDSTGRGHASTSVALVPGATTFYVQLVPGGVGAPSRVTDRGRLRMGSRRPMDDVPPIAGGASSRG